MAEKPHKQRLFAGIELDDAARARCAIAAESLNKTGFAAKYEAPEKLHVTLAFLGNIDTSSYDRIEGALIDTAASAGALTITFDKLGAFPHERRPRIVYVGAREQGAPFRSLIASVQAAYRALGFTFNDDPVAHVTIARVKDSARALPVVEIAPFRLEVRVLTLFESIFDAKANTSRYEIVKRANLSS